MKKFILLLSSIGLLAFTSCEKKEAVVATDEKEVAVATENAVVYAVDTSESKVEWRAYKVIEGETEEGGHHGFMKLKDGEVKFENNKVVAGQFIIDAASIESVDLNEMPDKKADLDGHLKSADFLNVEKYPTATFEITDIKDIEGDYNTEISGNLRMREDTKNITFKANTGIENDKLTVKSEEFTIDRQDFGVDFQSTGALIRDNVTIQVNLTADKAENATMHNLIEEDKKVVEVK